MPLSELVGGRQDTGPFMTAQGWSTSVLYSIMRISDVFCTERAQAITEISVFIVTHSETLTSCIVPATCWENVPETSQCRRRPSTCWVVQSHETCHIVGSKRRRHSVHQEVFRNGGLRVSDHRRQFCWSVAVWRDGDDGNLAPQAPGCKATGSVE